MTPPHVPRTRQLLILNDKEELILDLLRVVGYAALEDIHYVRFRDKSPASVRAILAKLSGGQDYAEGALLYRFPVPSTAKGTKPRAYALGPKAGELKAGEGYYRPSKARNLSYYQTSHNLSLSRFICSALLWEQTDPQVRLADIRMCYELARELRKVAAENAGQPAPVLVVPDAWVNVELLEAKTGVHKTYLPIWLEIDNSSMYRLRFQQHVEDRIEYIRSEKYAHFFGDDAVRIAYATIASDERRHSRLSAMRRWTEEVLTELKLEKWATVFYFTTLVYEDIYGLKHFSDPVWYSPGDPTPKRILEP